MKYIDSEKLIAELERQNVDKKVIEPVIRIITSLQQKQTEVDFEKEIIRYQREDMDRDTTVRDVARHFYELGQCNARMEDKP